MVLDPFCGCATTLEAANRLDRKWIGIDIAIHAIKRVARLRLTDRCGLVEGTDYEIKGVPRDIEGAKDLWTRDKYHFQKWAVEQVEGFVTTKRTVTAVSTGDSTSRCQTHEIFRAWSLK